MSTPIPTLATITGTEACKLTGWSEVPTGLWLALDCAVHGDAVTYADAAGGEQAIAMAWRNAHLAVIERGADVAAKSRTRLAAPTSPTCTYGAGCTSRTAFRIRHYVACYGWFVTDVCRYHRTAEQGRIYPDRYEVDEVRR